ncbi:MAG: DUF1800 family protein [Bacteroidota bacterium]
MKKIIHSFLFICVSILCSSFCYAQVDTIVIGFGGYEGVSITSSDDTQNNPENTLNQDGYLPNLNAAARFLSQASLGYNQADIENVTQEGIEDWVEAQLAIPMPYSLLTKTKEYHKYVKDGTGNPDQGSNARMWDYSWWQYHMTTNDYLRQRVALALSEILVISDKSGFGNNPYALSDYYDILLQNAFGNYRDIMEEITYHAAMGVYLTFVNNAKSNPEENQFPDENYAREIMQLFTIGLYMLNPDGTVIVDSIGNPVPTYDNMDILEFSKIFTGLTWADRDKWGKGAQKDTSYVPKMAMWNDYHEPGEKYLLNGYVVPDRNPVDGNADIDDALDNLFNHQNVGPFIGTLLIQRMVTSNPSPEYVERVTQAFNDNGEGVRGDMKAVIRAILLDPEAKACSSGNDPAFGKLREPFIRYFHINKAFNASTTSGDYRNDMDYIYRFVQQKPLTSPSVFNFYQYDYQPLGPIEEAGLFAPEFQITNAQTITGWINALYRFIVNENIADEYDLYNGEDNDLYADEMSTLDLSNEIMYTTDETLHILMDRLNLILAQGRMSQTTIDTIIEALKKFAQNNENDFEMRAKLAIYLTMTTPEYLINR